MTPLNQSPGVAGGHAGAAFAGLKDGFASSRQAALLNILAVSDEVELLALTGSDVTKLQQIFDHPPSPQLAAQLAQLLTSAASAAASGDVQGALAHLAAFAALDPQHAESLASAPGLASIRGEVTHLLAALTFAAKANAETKLDQARQMPQAPELNTTDRAIKPEVALQVAEQLITAGGYSNFVHSAELSQLVADYGRWVPSFVAATPVAEPEAPAIRFRVLLWMLIGLGALLLILVELLSR
jgi:hypothetical protein